MSEKIDYTVTRGVRTKDGYEDFELCSYDDKDVSFTISVSFNAENEIIKVETGAVQTTYTKTVDKLSRIIEMEHGFAGNAYKKYCRTLIDAGCIKEEIVE